MPVLPNLLPTSRVDCELAGPAFRGSFRSSPGRVTPKGPSLASNAPAELREKSATGSKSVLFRNKCGQCVSCRCNSDVSAILSGAAAVPVAPATASVSSTVSSSDDAPDDSAAAVSCSDSRLASALVSPSCCAQGGAEWPCTNQCGHISLRPQPMQGSNDAGLVSSRYLRPGCVAISHRFISAATQVANRPMAEASVRGGKTRRLSATSSPSTCQSTT